VRVYLIQDCPARSFARDRTLFHVRAKLPGNSGRLRDRRADPIVCCDARTKERIGPVHRLGFVRYPDSNLLTYLGHSCRCCPC